MTAHARTDRKSYVAPHRRGKRGILFPVDPATHDAFRDLAAELNSTAEYLGYEALKLLFEKKGKPVPGGVQERLNLPPTRPLGPRPKQDDDQPPLRQARKFTAD